MPYPKDFFYTLQTILIKQVTAKLEAGDISRRKKVKEKRPSPFLLSIGCHSIVNLVKKYSGHLPA